MCESSDSLYTQLIGKDSSTNMTTLSSPSISTFAGERGRVQKQALGSGELESKQDLPSEGSLSNPFDVQPEPQQSNIFDISETTLEEINKKIQSWGTPKYAGPTFSVNRRSLSGWNKIKRRQKMTNAR